MAGDDDDDHDDEFSQQHLISPSFSMVVIRESPADLVVFPPVNHENLQLASSTSLESPSGSSSSTTSSSRRSDSSSSFSLSPSDSDGQPSLSASESESDRNIQPETEGKSPSFDSTTCEFEQKPPSSISENGGKSPPRESDGNSLLSREAEIFRYWWELLLVSINSKLKRLLTWFSTTLRSFYPVLAIAIWWWMRVRARRRRFNGEPMSHLRDAIKERDERILHLLHQIAQMNEVLVNHHKDIVSRR